MVNRLGLYIMVFLTMMGVGTATDYSRQILDKVNKIEKTQSELELKVIDVIGKEEPEKFYEINGQRVYLEIDGKPVEQYFRK